ncbi:hypothetical protein PHYBLDRAFT_58368 [Phycomyces blakesleeanus NRRL 1555(-)]|uniref:O-fucosyltransferase family protein n=2 Tax=Phycomyces blakesleeanus TaxID=4837 RepID=A0A167Q9I4_PHYB8|nr:hypothetical protein PHYBLDRAFT_58368 [Phycomyces blakesleeanus NRRL 1555(-)]OAD79318.1 hypothetical protein PHYBLDRAFT_58368 [Phycomyces blakesleeanus NRRL 1555(-)]|eukprot:XP_018297358.1 hypothetical protein PHYBLDRAFT_58368 [Phycomyces blakesleeanus NRRL 1555(-)]
MRAFKIAIGLVSFSLLLILCSQWIPQTLPQYFSDLTGTTQSQSHNPQSSQDMMDDSSNDDETEKSTEKYVTYLPHSGFHNQRIALINAMVIAKSLNRTLIMPELNMGHANYWLPGKALALQFDDCSRKIFKGPHRVSLNGCYAFRSYNPWSVSSILDLSAVNDQGIRYVERNDMSLDFFEKNFGLTKDDTYYVQDPTRFSYRIYDNSSMDLGSFDFPLQLSVLRQRTEPLISFGSLFGSFRLAIEPNSELWWLREYLTAELGISHSVIMQDSLSIASHLGGPGNYISIHIRQGDGSFRKALKSTIVHVQAHLEKIKGRADPDAVEAMRQLSVPDRLKACVVVNHTVTDPHLRVIFMATDAHNSRESMADFHYAFPCMFTLNDFSNVISNLIETDHSIFLPLVDAEVASHSSRFVGTPKSTFSKYIKYRQRRWLKYYPKAPKS